MLPECKWHKYSKCRFKEIAKREPGLQDCLFCMTISALGVANAFAKIIADIGAHEWAVDYLRGLKFLFALRESVEEVGNQHFGDIMEYARSIWSSHNEAEEKLESILEKLSKGGGYIG